MKLKNWIASDFYYTDKDPISKILDYDVIEDINWEHPDYNKCPINRKNIYNWCIVSNGRKKYAVAFNENPSIGWSYPIKRLKS